jgi:hypothetical protein
MPRLQKVRWTRRTSDSLISADDAGGLRPGLWMGGVRLLVRAEDADRATEVLGPSE